MPAYDVRRIHAAALTDERKSVLPGSARLDPDTCNAAVFTVSFNDSGQPRAVYDLAALGEIGVQELLANGADEREAYVKATDHPSYSTVRSLYLGARAPIFVLHRAQGHWRGDSPEDGSNALEPHGIERAMRTQTPGSRPRTLANTGRHAH